MRVNVKGISGSGKSTFSRELADRLGVPYLEIDAIHHGPNWTEASAEELQARIRKFMARARDGWVIDGNYARKIGDLVTVTGFKAKNAPHVGNASTVTLASGKKLFAGSSAETESPQTGTPPAPQ